MLKIIGEGIRQGGAFFEYQLENGELLHMSEWNGECYTVKEKDGSETRYFPVYDEVDEDQFEIIGFEVRY